MKNMVVQFHAEPLELLHFISDTVSDQNIFIVLAKFRPFTVQSIEKKDIFDSSIINSDQKLIIFEQRPVLIVKDQIGFYKNNANALNVEIGELRENSLGESAISIRTPDEKIPAFAMYIFNKLKKWTLAGAVAVNPDTGAQSRLRAHRYTNEAKKLEETGIIMRPVGGKSHIHFRESK